MSIDDAGVPPVMTGVEYPRPWLCRRCQWAMFWNREEHKGVQVISFRCGYPDPELQRRAAEAGPDLTRCVQYRPRPQDWPLADRRDDRPRVFVNELPEEGI